MDPVTRRLLPRPIRRAGARLRAEVVASRIRKEIDRLARSGRPVLAGPWLGEVGFELLYWVPFLRWAVEEFGLDPARLVAISRGGPESWYRGIAAHYRDAFDYLTPDEFRERNEERRREVGEQKQVRSTALEEQLVERVRADTGLADACVLHPSLMYTAMQPYWWQHQGIEWVDRFTRYRPLTPPETVPGLELPDAFIAVKFYFNECFGLTPRNQAFVTTAMQSIGERAPVVSLSTGLHLDDHPESAASPHGLDLGRDPVMTARNNLAVQTFVVAHSREFIGTYGGFSYLAPFLGVEATAVWSDRDGFDPRHLELAQRVLAGQPGGALHVMPVEETLDAWRTHGRASV